MLTTTMKKLRRVAVPALVAGLLVTVPAGLIWAQGLRDGARGEIQGPAWTPGFRAGLAAGRMLEQGGRAAAPGTMLEQRGRAGAAGRMLEQRGRAGAAGRLGRADVGRRRAGRGMGLAVRALRQAEALELTDEQQQQLDDLRDAARRATVDRRAARQTAALDLRELMEVEEPDLDAVEAALGRLSNLRDEGILDGLRLDRQVRQVLTAEQLEELRPAGRPAARRARAPRRGR